MPPPPRLPIPAPNKLATGPAAGPARPLTGTLLRIIDDILDFSKIESGKLTLDEATFNPTRLVEDVVLMFAQRVREKSRRHKMEILAAPDSALPDGVLGDASRVRQILTNLVSNAVKFTNRGEVVLSAEPCVMGEGTSGIRFTVRDTGIGIPADKRVRIFEKFTQADDLMTTRHFGGTGLGLAICRQLVALSHAGDGQEALEQLLKGGFSLVLMDIDMPWMDGATSAEFIRTMKYRGEIEDMPVIAVTADNSEATYQRCMASGMVDVIPKHVWKPKWEELIVERLDKIMQRVDACWLPVFNEDTEQ